MSIKNPVNQKVLTNVAIVRLKKGGKHFELACYRNKITNWRNKQETDINEVVQIKQIFANATSGEKASNKDLKVFGSNMSQDEIFMEILNKGEYQVSDIERETSLENLRKEVAHVIVGMCVNPEDLSSYPLSIILKAMNQCKVKLSEKQPAKKQAVDIVKDL
jgi:ribosome maturation protein SDO1